MSDLPPIILPPLLVTDPALKPWIGRGQVIASRWSDANANLLVVVQDAKDDSYSLLRAFRLPNSVAISVDVSHVDAHRMFNRLIERIA